MNQIMPHLWSHNVDSPFCEFDPQKLIERIGLAEAAISSSMNYKTAGNYPSERQSMADALLSLVMPSSALQFRPHKDEPEDNEEDNDREPKELEKNLPESYSA
jgi:hypothetical protein